LGVGILSLIGLFRPESHPYATRSSRKPISTPFASQTSGETGVLAHREPHRLVPDETFTPSSTNVDQLAESLKMGRVNPVDWSRKWSEEEMEALAWRLSQDLPSEEVVHD
jgi:hypothetical protein